MTFVFSCLSYENMTMKICFQRHSSISFGSAIYLGSLEIDLVTLSNRPDLWIVAKTNNDTQHEDKVAIRLSRYL